MPIVGTAAAEETEGLLRWHCFSDAIWLSVADRESK